MRIAILILAHKNKKQLLELLKIIHEDFNVYLHIDGKWKIDLSEFKMTNVKLVKKRYKISWGNYNQIRATIELMKMAYSDMNEYFFLISGQDIPVKSNIDIKNFVVQEGKFNYIEYFPLPNNKWGELGGLERISLYWENNNCNLFSRLFFGSIRKFQKIFHLYRPFDMPLYGGANWFNLNRKAVSYVLNRLNQNLDYLYRFKFTRCADEIWLQTILLNSTLKIRNDTLRYIDWETGPEFPRILRESDYGKIINSEKLFARKFDDVIDNKIIKKLINKRY